MSSFQSSSSSSSSASWALSSPPGSLDSSSNEKFISPLSQHLTADDALPLNQGSTALSRPKYKAKNTQAYIESIMKTGAKKRKRGRRISQGPSRRLALLADSRVGLRGLEVLAAAHALPVVFSFLDDKSLAALQTTARLPQLMGALKLAWLARLERVGGNSVMQKYILASSDNSMDIDVRLAYAFHERVHRKWRGDQSGPMREQRGETVQRLRRIVRVKCQVSPFSLQAVRLSDSERDREFSSTTIMASAGPNLKLGVHDLAKAVEYSMDISNDSPYDVMTCADTSKLVRSCALTGSFGDATLVTGSSDGLEVWSHKGEDLRSQLVMPNDGASVISLYGRWSEAELLSCDSRGHVSLWDICRATQISTQTAVEAKWISPIGEREVMLATYNEVWRWDPRCKLAAHAGLQLVYQDTPGNNASSITSLGACSGRFAISKGDFQGVEMHDLRRGINGPRNAVKSLGKGYGGGLQFDDEKIMLRARRPFIDPVACTHDLVPVLSFELPVSQSGRDRLSDFCSDSNSVCVVRSDASGQQIFMWNLEPEPLLMGRRAVLDTFEPVHRSSSSSSSSFTFSHLESAERETLFSYESCFVPRAPALMPKPAARLPSTSSTSHAASSPFSHPHRTSASRNASFSTFPSSSSSSSSSLETRGPHAFSKRPRSDLGLPEASRLDVVSAKSSDPGLFSSVVTSSSSATTGSPAFRASSPVPPIPSTPLSSHHYPASSPPSSSTPAFASPLPSQAPAPAPAPPLPAEPSAFRNIITTERRNAAFGSSPAPSLSVLRGQSAATSSSSSSSASPSPSPPPPPTSSSSPWTHLRPRGAPSSSSPSPPSSTSAVSSSALSPATSKLGSAAGLSSRRPLPSSASLLLKRQDLASSSSSSLPSSSLSSSSSSSSSSSTSLSKAHTVPGPSLEALAPVDSATPPRGLANCGGVLLPLGTPAASAIASASASASRSPLPSSTAASSSSPLPFSAPFSTSPSASWSTSSSSSSTKKSKIRSGVRLL